MEQVRCLNMEVIRECFGADRKRIRGSMGFYLGAAALLLLMAGLLYGLYLRMETGKILVVALFFCLMGLFILILGWRQLRVQRGIDRLAFYLAEDVCTGKSVAQDHTDTPSRFYYLHFEHFGKMELHFPHIHLTNRFRVNPNGAYNSAEEGDGFYLLYMNKGKKPICIFSKKEWTLDAAEFQTENGRIRPVGSGAGR